MKFKDYLNKCLKDPAFKICWDLDDESDTSIIIGKDENDDLKIKDLKELKNILIVGATGSGKSIFLHTVLTELLVRNSSDDLKVVIFDPKCFEFSKYNKDPHLLFPVLKNNKEEILNALNNLLNIVNERFENKGRKYPEIVVLVDEYCELFYIDEKVNDLFIEILKHGSEVGVHLILALQNPTKEIVGEQLRDLIPCRIVLLVTSKEESKLLIGSEDAVNLKGNGDMLFKESETSPIKHLQVLYISNEEIKEILK
jgi:DNA segregation ATPase FtsK/SpoIIIE, S-DNA-T family